MEAITVALITVVGSILVVLIEKGRRENKEDHGYVKEHLERIEDKIDNHVRDHVVGFIHTPKNLRRKKSGSQKKEQ